MLMGNERRLAFFGVLVGTILWIGFLIFVFNSFYGCTKKPIIHEPFGTIVAIDLLNRLILVEMKCTSHSSLTAIVHFEWENFEDIEVGQIVYLNSQLYGKQ